MADERLVELLKRDAGEWNAFVEERRAEDRAWRADLSGADLEGADLSSANLVEANLVDANLVEANLVEADLLHADFYGAILYGANLTGADLNTARFTSANLSGANLTGAILAFANLRGANLRGANLTRVVAQGTLFVEVDLVHASGLATIKHNSSSTVGTNTLALSEGKIPDVFLKGCGLADWEIELAKLHNPDLTEDEQTDIHYRAIKLQSAAPIQINPVFLSYAHEDNLFVDELQEALDEKGVRSWRDKHDAEVGPLEKVIDRAIRMNPTVLLVLSEASVESDWVGWEIEKARALEKELKRPVLCPVAIDGAWLSGLRPDLRSAVKRYAVLDLSEDGAIEREMSRILKGLQIHYREGVGDG